MASNLTELRAELEAKKAEIEVQTAPLHKQADEIRAKIHPHEAALREVTQAIKKIETESKLREISMEIAHIARAQGARTLVNEGAAKPAPAAQ